MKTKSLLMIIATSGITFFNTDPLPDPLSKEKAIAALTKINSSYSIDINSFINSDANLAKEAIGNIEFPFNCEPMKVPINKRITISDVKRVLEHSKELKGDGFWDIDLESNAGTWQKVNEKWIHSLTPTNKIIVVFSYNGGKDNATLTFFDYKKKTVSYGINSMNYMSSLSCKLEVNGMKNPVFGWNYSADYSISASSTSMKIEFAHTLGEHTVTQSVGISELSNNESSKLITKVLEEIKKSDDVLRGTSYETTETLIADEVKSTFIAANFRVKNIITKWDISLNQNTITTSNPDDFIKMAVWTTSEAKVADVGFHSEGEYIPYLKYSDGSEAKVSSIIKENLWYALKEFMDDIVTFITK